MILNLQHYWTFWFEVSAMHLGSYNPLWTLLPRSCFDLSPTPTGYACNLSLKLRVRQPSHKLLCNEKQIITKSNFRFSLKSNVLICFLPNFAPLCCFFGTPQSRLDVLTVRYQKRVESLKLRMDIFLWKQTTTAKLRTAIRYFVNLWKG